MDFVLNGRDVSVEEGELCRIEWVDPAGSAKDQPDDVTPHFLRSSLQFIRIVKDRKRGDYIQFGHTYDEDEEGGEWYGVESVPVGCILKLSVDRGVACYGRSQDIKVVNSGKREASDQAE